MRKWIWLLLTVVLALAVSVASADTAVEVQVDLEFRYDMTECMLDRINKFRTNDPWMWELDGNYNQYKAVVTGLAPLVYDYGLERIAMQRAAECAVHYDHIRPDGTVCYAIYPDGAWAIGENIAAGQSSVSSVFKAWKEEDYDYSGQGHRRNMLSASFSRIGIGCVCVDGMYYWCQAFSDISTGEGKSSLKGPATVSATVEMLVSDGITNLAASPDSLKIREGSSASLPKLTGNCGGWGQTAITLPAPPWTVSDPAIAKTEGGKVIALKGGRTTLKVSLGSKLSVSLVSVCNEHTWDGGKVTKKPTCTAKGSRTFCCTVCGETKKEGIEKKPHTLSENGRQEPTCTKDGREACWECSVCGKLFSDSNGETEIAEPIVIARLGHIWGEPVYTWSDDNGKVTAKRVCERDTDHKEKETVTTTYKVIREATTETSGSGIYTSAAFRNKAFTVQTRTVEIPPYPTAWKDKYCRYAISDDLTAVVTGPARASLKKVVIPDTVKVNGKAMKVVGIEEQAFRKMKKLVAVTIGKYIKSIGKDAFSGCKKLKAITIRSTLLTKKNVKSGAFKGIHAQATVNCPKKKLKDYRKFLPKRGVPKTAKFK